MKLTYVTEEHKLETLNDLTLGDPEKRNREPKSLCAKKKKEMNNYHDLIIEVIAMLMIINSFSCRVVLDKRSRRTELES